MTDPGFKLEGIHQAIPFRPRRVFSEYQVFSDAGRAILVEPATALGLRICAGKARPLETGGLLSGRALRDADGHYVLVSGFVEANHGSGKAAAFEIPPEATAKLREESSRANPTGDVVGWWHSHLHPSPFSQTDLNSQRMWRQSDSVGLLVFANGEPWAAAYIGPEATELGYQSVGPLASQAGTHMNACPKGNSMMATNAGRDEPMLTIPSPRGHRALQLTRQQRGLIRLAAIVATVLLLILITGLTLLAVENGLSSRLSSVERTLSTQISSEQSQLSGEITRARATPYTNASISWSCIPAPSSPGSLSCNAVTSGFPGTVQWRLDGQFYARGASAIIHVPRDHRAHRIQAVLKTPTGIFPGTIQTINIG